MDHASSVAGEFERKRVRLGHSANSGDHGNSHARWQRARALVLALAVVVCAHDRYMPIAAQGRGLEGTSYTALQAGRGAPLFAQHCAPCHGTNLQGTDFGPGLAGAQLLERWKDRTLGELLTLMRTTMPLTSPGGLS